MALNLETLAGTRFLRGQRLLPLPAARPQQVRLGRSGQYLQLRARPVASNNVAVEAAAAETQVSSPPAQAEEHLHMNTFRDYLVLKPEETTNEELFRLLRDGNIGAIESIGCPDGTVVDDDKRRRMIFISIVLQKIILSVAKPGGTTNMMVLMNLLAEHGIPKLIWDHFTGQLKMPDPNSMDFKSPFAFIDTRVKLEKNIKPGDSAYYAHLSVMASKLAYENEARIKSIVRGYWDMEFLGFYNCWEDFQDSFCTQAFMMSDKPVESGDAELVVVAFRGTDDAYDACTDIDFSFYEIPGVGRVHGGFMKALGLQKDGLPKEIVQDPQTPYAYYVIRERLRSILEKNPKAQVVVTGHSLGGALSALFPVVLKLHGEDGILERIKGVYTFGQPRVGDGQLGKFAESILDSPKRRYFRFVYSNDLVPRVPFDDNTWLFKHFGKCLYYDSMYRGQEVHEEPNENYFASEYFIPKHLDATWELARSFGIGHVRGPDYHESLMMRMMRAMGLLIPGLPCHSPQDYNNLTRLGTLMSTAIDNSD
ncbi:uncharacterized protein M6B38_368230 [Iris pallida]|uniref:Fungal lipase-type domain-containing protein n=1 Tax=Iris pallida TaxID=29817 RepID=A0AAX6GFZ0_IRIPA|nr:uncharacterized protein M6B38_368230 [Iris pallida]